MSADDFPHSAAIVQAMSDDDHVQVSYVFDEKRFFVILTLDEAMTHAQNIMAVAKGVRKRAKVTRRKLEGA